MTEPFSLSDDDVYRPEVAPIAPEIDDADKKQIVVLASGPGTTFEAIMNACETNALPVKIKCLIADRFCGATAKANRHSVIFHLINRHAPKEERESAMITLCQNADLIVLAGYLGILPKTFVQTFQGKVINLHPSLLPDHSGMGMYGMKVHESVIASGDAETGCTVHYVDEGVDTGPIIAQTIVPVTALDTPHSLSEKLRPEEHKLLIQVIKDLTS